MNGIVGVVYLYGTDNTQLLEIFCLERLNITRNWAKDKITEFEEISRLYNPLWLKSFKKIICFTPSPIPFSYRFNSFY